MGEDGIPKETSTSTGDLMKALKFNNPSNPTTFTFSLGFALPKKQSTGKFTASIVGTDQTKSEYFCLEVSFAYAATASEVVVGNAKRSGCTSDKDCPSSYCQASGQCHSCGDSCCLTDADCGKGYCLNDKTKTPPYFCHGGVTAEWKKLV